MINVIMSVDIFCLGCVDHAIVRHDVAQVAQRAYRALFSLEELRMEHVVPHRLEEVAFDGIAVLR